jgi:hypothetical protein
MSDLQPTEPDTTSPFPHGTRSTPAYKRLTHSQLGVILRLHADGRPQTAIAHALGVDQSAISLALKRLGTDSSELAKHHFKATSYRAARKVTGVLESGKPDERLKAAKVVLEAAGVISGANSQIQLGVSVVIGGAQQPAFDSSSITVESAGNALDTTVATLPIESERV